MKNRNMRTVVSLVLAVAAGLLLAAVLLQAFYLTKDIEVAVQSTGAAKIPGETVTLEVWIGENPGFTQFEWSLDYDRTRLELLSINDTYTNVDGEKTKYLPRAGIETGVREEDGLRCGFVKGTLDQVFREENVPICSATFLILEDASVGVADVRIFGVGFSRAKGENGKVRSVDHVATEGGVLVGESLCEHVDEEKDTWCDLCGRQIARVEPFYVAGSSMTLGNELELNFLVKKSEIDAVTRSLTAYVTHVTEDDEIVWELPEGTWESYDIYYKISVRVMASQMTDQLSIQLKDQRGYIYNHAYSTSVQNYAARTLEQPGTTDAMRTLIVDMLNYGTSAQMYFDYKADDPANAGLTPELQALASAPVTCVDSRVKGAAYVGSALSLEERILLNVIFDGINKENLEDMYAEISYTDVLGEEQFFTVPGKNFEQYGTYGYSVPVDQIVLADASQLVTVTVKNADGSVHGSASDSVQSYISRMSEDDVTGIHSNIMKCAASAYRYVSNK